MKNLILTLVALIAVAVCMPTITSAGNRVNSNRAQNRVQNRSHQQRNNVNVVRLGSRLFVLNDFDQHSHRNNNQIDRIFNSRAFNSRVFDRHDNDEFIVSTFINGDGDKVGVTNFGNELIIQRNARLSDSRFFGFNSRRVGGFDNHRASSIAERALFNAFLNSQRHGH